jgi:alkylation response protein AidB-like acyl-CoA dehydrogenase
MSATTTSARDAQILGPAPSVVRYDDPYRLEFREWLAANVPAEPEPLEYQARMDFRRDWQRRLARDGWAGPSWPARYGGRGAGPLQQFVYYEELALARAPALLNPQGIVLLGQTLMVHGTEEQRERFLPGLLTGDEVWSQGYSEPEAGSDLASLSTRATLDGDAWVVDGRKIWTGFAAVADFCFLLCRTDPDAQRHRGLSLLIVPMNLPGIHVRLIEDLLGYRHFAEVTFEGVRSPRELIVGRPGDGWAVSMTMFQFERADQGFTDHARLLVELDDIAGELRAARAAAGTLPPAAATEARATWAGLWVRCQQLRRMNLRAALQGERGEAIGASGSVAKLFWSELAQDLAALHVRVRGLAGLDPEDRVARHLLDTRSYSIFSGTNEIQRNIIGERLLGLPR